MINIWSKKSGKLLRAETIVEVIVALVVITIGATAATSLILSSLRATNYNKNSLVALNLAQEGIEYMRNTRDTNWLRFSGNQQVCWNTDPNVATCANDGSDGLDGTDNTNGYALGLDASGKMNLMAVAWELDLSDGVEPSKELNYQVKHFSSATNGDYLGSFDNFLVGGDTTAATIFYRSIDVSYATIGTGPGWAVTDGVAKEVADMMLVTCSVEWMDGGSLQKVSLSSALTRYK